MDNENELAATIRDLRDDEGMCDHDIAHYIHGDGWYTMDAILDALATLS